MGSLYMAQFLAEIKGSRGAVTRLGTKNSGITCRVNGWHVGARVEISHINNKDVVRVYKTKGSSRGPEVLISEYEEDSTWL